MLWWNGVMKTWRREELCEDICEAQSTSTRLLQQWDAFHARHSGLFRRSTARQDTFQGFSHAVAHVSIRIDPLPNLKQGKPLLVPKTRMRHSHEGHHKSTLKSLNAGTEGPGNLELKYCVAQWLHSTVAQQCFGRLAVTSRAQWWSSCLFHAISAHARV